MCVCVCVCVRAGAVRRGCELGLELEFGTRLGICFTRVYVSGKWVGVGIKLRLTAYDGNDEYVSMFQVSGLGKGYDYG